MPVDKEMMEEMEMNEEQIEQEGMMMEGDVMAQLDKLAADYPKVKKEVEALRKKLDDEMPSEEEMEYDEDEMMSEDVDEMDFEDEEEDLDKILG